VSTSLCASDLCVSLYLLLYEYVRRVPAAFLVVDMRVLFPVWLLDPTLNSS
jgi:hypothetical protein